MKAGYPVPPTAFRGVCTFIIHYRIFFFPFAKCQYKSFDYIKIIALT